jgi:hypothetical protein
MAQGGTASQVPLFRFATNPTNKRRLWNFVNE